MLLPLGLWLDTGRRFGRSPRGRNRLPPRPRRRVRRLHYEFLERRDLLTSYAADLSISKFCDTGRDGRDELEVTYEIADQSPAGRFDIGIYQRSSSAPDTLIASKQVEVLAARAINSKGDGRQAIPELVVMNRYERG